MAHWDEAHARERASLSKTHLAQLRKICLALPETTEVDRFGGVWFKAGKRVFVTLHHAGAAGADHRLAIAFATTRDDQEALCHEPMFYPTPYMHQHGWTTMKADAPDWELVAELAMTAYRNVALKRMLKALDG